ncbi:heme exporter protein CcmB [Methylobacillus gramineus]|uniref:heme exporter protein CcmB n=1 Tax=Methylobacillus gramineus TaxID=755169 RepID=UPI001CFF71BA|nr:heme exporter protein CcmB [Methylobacillus gramineus]MCB5183618.1 heme exporter protein CcmB [Methylobacillus gramineus]
MIAFLIEVVRRDLLLAVRRPADAGTVLIFFVVVASLFPLAGNPDPVVLGNIAPGVLWVSALLACLLSLPRIFSGDYADGSLEQMVIAPQPLSVLVLGKIVVHWLISALPLVLLAPVLGLQYGLQGEPLFVLVLSLLLGTPTLSLIGAIGAALTLGSRGGGVLVSVLVLPLYIPVLIFGAGAVVASQAGLEVQAYVMLLVACFLLSLVVAPWATSIALRIALE